MFTEQSAAQYMIFSMSWFAVQGVHIFKLFVPIRAVYFCFVWCWQPSAYKVAANPCTSAAELHMA